MLAKHQQVIDLYKAGKSYAYISATTGISLGYARVIVRRVREKDAEAIPLRRKTPRPFLMSEYNKILMLVQRGYAVRTIAAKMDRPFGTIGNLIRRMRDSGELAFCYQQSEEAREIARRAKERQRIGSNYGGQHTAMAYYHERMLNAPAPDHPVARESYRAFVIAQANCIGWASR